MRYQVIADDGSELDAHFELHDGSIVFLSRGGSAGRGTARNRDYTAGLKLLLERLQLTGRWIADAFVDSSVSLQLPLKARQILDPENIPNDATQLISEMSMRMARVGRAVGTSGGNPTKRIRLSVTPTTSDADLATILRGVRVPSSRSEARLPVEELKKVKPTFIWRAVKKLRDGFRGHDFDDSDRYDLLDDDGTRLAPKAVFGVAATEALGFEVKPVHFVGGEDSPAFRLLRAADYEIVLKDTPSRSEPDDLNFDAERPQAKTVEERRRYREHRSIERKSSTSKKVKRLKGHVCEACGFEYSQRYGELGVGYIEAHHLRPLASLRLDEKVPYDLELDFCVLCANCHRMIHRQDDPSDVVGLRSRILDGR